MRWRGWGRCPEVGPGSVSPGAGGKEPGSGGTGGHAQRRCRGPWQCLDLAGCDAVLQYLVARCGGWCLWTLKGSAGQRPSTAPGKGCIFLYKTKVIIIKHKYIYIYKHVSDETIKHQGECFLNFSGNKICGTRVLLSSDLVSQEDKSTATRSWRSIS